MGDFGDMAPADPLLPRAEDFPHRTKSNAIHIEDTTSLVQEVTERTRKMHMSSDDPDTKPVDSPMAISNAPSSIKSADDTDDSDDIDIVRGREQLEQVATFDPDRPSRAPSPMRQRMREPKFWEFDGDKAGQAHAQWKEEMVSILRDHTAHMSIEERTSFFDDLIAEDKDHYVQPLAAYYFDHPEHIPDRKPSADAQKKMEQGFKDNPRIRMRQNNVFKNWQWDPNAPTVDVEPPVGPKNETIPGEIPECEHCIKEAKKSKLRKRASTIVAPVLNPFRRRRAATVMTVSPKDAGRPKTQDSTESADTVNDEKSKTSSGSTSEYSEKATDHSRELGNALRRAQTQLQAHPRDIHTR